MNRLDRMKNLIDEAKTKEVYSWLSGIETDHARFEIRGRDRTIPTENVQRIYSVRARINEANGGPILGFEELLRNLGLTGADGIVIHLMEHSADRQYFVFTDPELNELLGILGPLRTETESLERFDNDIKSVN